jgi:bacillolysin
VLAFAAALEKGGLAMFRNLACAVTTALILAGCSCAPGSGADAGSDAGNGLPPDQVEASAREQLKTRLTQLGLGDADLVATSITVDDLGYSHARFQQQYQGIPVFTGEAIVHFAPDGSPFFITDALVDHPSVDTTPTFSAAQAITSATTALGCTDCLSTAPETALYVFRAGTTDHLVHRVALVRLDGTEDMAEPVSFIDAHDGTTLLAYDDLNTVTVPTLYAGDVEIQTTAANGHHYMENATAQIGAYPYGAVVVQVDATTSRKVETPSSTFIDDTDRWDDADPNKRAVNDAYWGVTKTVEYLTEFGRSGIDDKFGPATRWEDDANGVADASGKKFSTYRAVDGKTGLVGVGVLLNQNFLNASWSHYNRRMMFGRGDGVKARPLVSLDVTGHEMFHGVTGQTAKLVYAAESGALNEAWSDAFAAALVTNVRGDFDWKIGAQFVLPAGSAPLRYMDEPTRVDWRGRMSPDHYRERKPTSPADKSTDFGYVHSNSGIANKAFYLLAKGGTHRKGGKLTAPVGTQNAMRIWYDALVSYMTSGTDFAQARIATQQAALARFGPAAADKVKLAWGLVGVGACDDKGQTIGECPQACSTGIANRYTVVSLVLHDADGNVTTLFKPRALNNRGDVVGTTSGALRNFQIWDHNGNKMIDEVLPTSSNITPVAMNDSGDITGLIAPASWTATTPIAEVTPFHWIYDRSLRVITTRDVLAFPYSMGVGVNNNGQILIHRFEPGSDSMGNPVVRLCPGMSIQNCSLIWKDGAATVNNDSANNSPRAINDLGQVAGQVADDTNSNAPYLALGGNVSLGSAFDALSSFGPVPSWTLVNAVGSFSINGEPYLLNNSSKVVLGVDQGLSLYDGTIKPLVLSPAFAPKSMNDSDVMVGDDGSRGYAYDKGNVIDLTARVADPATGTPKVIRAWRINNCGEILVSMDFFGTPERCSGTTHCYALLKPVPEP